MYRDLEIFYTIVGLSKYKFCEMSMIDLVTNFSQLKDNFCSMRIAVSRRRVGKPGVPIFVVKSD